jgi:malonyl-CoA decarboxylase
MSRVSLLSDLLSSIGARSWFLGDEATRRIELPELAALCHRLVSSRGEASGVRLAADILKGIRSLDNADAERFFAILADEFGPEEAALLEAADAYTKEPGPATLSKLQRVAEPPRQELFRRLNLAPGGTAEIVRLRERLLPFLRKDRERLCPVDDDLRHLFQSWFNRGFLLMRPIDWDTPASILEKIIRYEAVHAIATWEELRQRLAPADRRCFAFFHPSIPDDPLIFVEVALTGDIPASIASVLDPARPVLAPENAQTAVFYSISNCHAGLAGVSFGSFLIKQVAEDLKETVPNLRNFVTLSPVPGFAAWLAGRSAAGIEQLEANEKQAIAIVAKPGWTTDPAKVEAARPGLLSLGARYFLRAKRPDGRPVDPVARFHLGNGAMLNRIMHVADTSASGLAQAHGLMVNYLYDLPRVEQRHEAYAGDAEIAASRAVLSLLPGRGSAMKDVA